MVDVLIEQFIGGRAALDIVYLPQFLRAADAQGGSSTSVLLSIPFSDYVFLVEGTGLSYLNGRLVGGTIISLTMGINLPDGSVRPARTYTAAGNPNGIDLDVAEVVDAESSMELEALFADWKTIFDASESAKAAHYAAGVDFVVRGLGGHVTGSRGADDFYGSEFRDLIFGGGGGDFILGRGGNDRIEGGNGNDQAYGGNGKDTVYGGGGNDSLGGEERADKLYGGAGADDLNGGAAADRLYGGAGNDSLNGGLGPDKLFGGAGIDLASYSFSEARVTVDLRNEARNKGEAARDAFTSIEGAIGTDFNDLLIGTNDRNRLYGSGGADELRGLAGDDVLSGDDGNDKVYGGAGNDQLFGRNGRGLFDGGTGNDIIDLTADGKRDTFVFADGYDRDRILLFERGTDRLQLNDNLWQGNRTAAEVVDRFATINGAGTIITFDFGGGDVLIVEGTNLRLNRIDDDIVIV